MARTPAHRRHARSGTAKSTKPKAATPETAQETTPDDYRILEAQAALATQIARAEPSPNTYRAAAASHRAAAHTAEEAGLSEHVEGHDLFARELDETAETLAAARRAESLRSGPDLETDVRQILDEESRRPRSRRRDGP